eukprot:585824-Prorocentrum_minimum.AAC.3
MAQIVYDTHETCLLRGSECAAPALKPLLLAGRPGVVERLKEAGVAFDWDHTMDPAEASDGARESAEKGEGAGGGEGGGEGGALPKENATRDRNVERNVRETATPRGSSDCECMRTCVSERVDVS